MNDCRNNRINGHNFNYHSWLRVHNKCARWLSSALQNSDAVYKIVVSHHCPYMSTEIRRYVGAMAESAYSTPALTMMDDFGIKTWIHGHIHLQLQNQEHGINIVSNPMGYVDDNEHQKFSHNVCI